MQTNIMVKIIVGETAISKLKFNFLVKDGFVENKDTIVFTANNVIGISMKNRSTSNSGEFSLGVTSLMGSVELRDLDGYLFYLTTNKFIGENIEIRVYDGSTLLNVFYATKDWEYSNQNKQVKIELKGKTSFWADISTFGIKYQENLSGYNLLNQLLAMSNLDAEDFIMSVDVVNYLEKFLFTKAFLSPGTLQEIWNKFCCATLLFVYESAGKIVVERF